MCDLSSDKGSRALALGAIGTQRPKNDPANNGPTEETDMAALI
jgi:hypothetical protein